MEEDTSTPRLSRSYFTIDMTSQSSILLKDPTRVAWIPADEAALWKQEEYDLMWGTTEYWDKKEKKYEANKESDIRFLMKTLGYSRKKAKILVERHTPKFFRPVIKEETTITSQGLYSQLTEAKWKQPRQIGKYSRQVIEETLAKIFKHSDGRSKEEPKGDP